MIIYKLFAGRPRDIEDVENILRKMQDINFKEVNVELQQLSELTDNPQIMESWRKLKE